MENLVLEQRKAVATFAGCQDISTGPVSTLTRNILWSRIKGIIKRSTRETPLLKILRHLRVGAVVAPILLDPEAATREG